MSIPIVGLPLRLGKKLSRRYKYGVPLFQKNVRRDDLADVFEEIGEIKSCAIIGKGNSIKSCNPINEIGQCDLKIILNRVEVENLTDFIGDRIDAQIGMPPGLYTILPKKLLRQFEIRFIISNKVFEDPRFNIFYNSYRTRGIPVCCVPDDKHMKYDYCKLDYPHATQCGSILKILYNIDSLERIVFAGIDFFRFGYHTTNVDKRACPAAPPPNNDKLKGDPLKKFIFETVPKRNATKPLTVYFPSILKPLIDFPDLPCFKFYEGFQE
ncbi:MAG: hypothetical protein KAR47_20710 [Planctomycetes bacterium]|nr:hypothetical protein [Planctomycetota bacterium]